jgi:putative hydrolase of the HAD superfamily
MTGIEIVLFDAGDVVFRFQPERRLHALMAATGLEPEDIHARLWESGFSSDCDRGAFPAAPAMCAAVRQRLSCALTDAELARIWSLAFEPDPDVLAVAARLRARGLRTGLLTNNSSLVHAALERHHTQTIVRFDPLLFSYQLGASKPDPALWSAVAKELALRLDQLLLIDDTARNVESALAAGLPALQFTGLAELELALSP